MSMLRAIVTDYYPRIDRVDTDWVLSLFAEDAIYERAGITYDGLPEIRKFFTVDRRIRGVHVIDGLWSDDATGTVFVTGCFEGKGAEGDARAVTFADIWHFNDQGLVRKRQTYLGLGHAYVAR